MKFVDEIIITIESGKGGRGCVSFRRERFVPKGGPDGGDGGKGGDVVFKATTRKHTLYDFRFQKRFKAENGHGGEGCQRTGRNGEDMIIEVPVGVILKDADTGEVIYDFTRDEETFVAALGGRGGQGNKKFATSTHRTPRFAQPGEPGEEKCVQLDLKLIADVGITGLPNAGKSTLITVMTMARPKCADYPFTTLSPNLGVVTDMPGEPVVVADIPGLIEGAHEGAGLGVRFLKHVERTRLLIHLIDASSINPEDVFGNFDIINRELTQYSPDLACKPQIVVLNKKDIPEAVSAAEAFKEAYAARFGPDSPAPLFISAASGEGVKDLIMVMVKELNRLETPEDQDEM